MMALATMLGLSALTVQGGEKQNKTEPTIAKAKTEEYIKVGGYNYTKNQIEMFNEINRYRVLTGARKVKLNYKLSKSAENHSKYVCYNGEGTAMYHYQKKGYKYFTGVSVPDRVKYVGYKNPMKVSATNDFEIYKVAESNIKYVTNVVENTVYHRQALLDNRLYEVGPSKSDCVATVDGSYGYTSYEERDSYDSRLITYPYPNQKNLDVNSSKFNEYPSPDGDFNIPITQVKGQYITWESGYSYDKKRPNSRALYDDKGNKVKIAETYYGGEYDRSITSGYIVPVKPLKYDTKYTMKVSFYQDRDWAIKDQPDKIDWEWSFTTKKSPYVKHPTTKIGHVVAKSGAKLQMYTSSGKKSKVITSKSAPVPITKVTSSAYYLADKSYIKKSPNAAYYVGKLGLKATTKSVKSSTGKYYKTYKKGQTLKITKVTGGSKYYINSSEYIKKKSGVTSYQPKKP